MGKFIWTSTGKLLRVSMSEIKNPVEKGGLGLTCISTMSKSLLMSQLLRLLRCGEHKYIDHLRYWMGELLCEFCDIIEDGEHSNQIPTYYFTLGEIIAQARISDIVTSNNWRTITNRIIYRKYAAAFPSPSIVLTAPSCEFDEVWRKLCLPVLRSESREALFLAIHNKLPVRDRLFRIGLSDDPYCQYCVISKGAVFCNIAHYFCECILVADSW